MITYLCCKKCKKRFPGCQSNECLEWAETRERVEAEREKIRENRQKYKAEIKGQIESIERRKKRREKR